jgi:hypothetical protein
MNLLDEYYNVFIYCGGKCGSSTLCTTFNQYFKTIQLHTNKYYKINLKKNKNVFDTIDLSCTQYENVYFIDSYRLPIERKISSFFQNINSHVPNYKSLKIKELIHIFNTKYIYTIEEYHSINEVMTYYNVPLFDTFDFDKRYNIVQKDNKIFIKVLFKDITQWENIFSDIFSCKITIYNNNISEYKNYNSIYQTFKDNYLVPKKYIETKLLQDQEFKIYNTKQEQYEYIQHWLKKSY